MNKLRTFATTFRKSLTDLSYYKDILKAPLSFSIKYIFFLVFVLSLIYSFTLAGSISLKLPQIPAFAQKLKASISDFYPGELVLKIKNGELETNVIEPYYIDLGEKYSDSNFGHFITIDTGATSEQYESYHTAFLVTKKSIVFHDQKGGYRVQPLSEIKDTIFIDKNAYDKIIKNFLPILDYMSLAATVLIILLVTLIPFSIAFFWGIAILAYLIFAAFLVFLIAKLLKKSLTFSQVYRLSIHGMTLPLILYQAQNMAHFRIPYSYNVLFLIFMVIVLKYFDAKKEDLAKGKDALKLLFAIIFIVGVISAATSLMPQTQKSNSPYKKTSKKDYTKELNIVKAFDAQEKQKKLIKKTLESLTDGQKKTFNRFLKENDIPESARQRAALLYFYPYGFFEPVGGQKSRYYSSYFDFGITIPDNWTLFPNHANRIYFLSPDTIIGKSPEGQDWYYEYNTAYDLRIIESCKPETATPGFFQEPISQNVEDFIKTSIDTRLALLPVKVKSGPEHVKFGRMQAIKYVFTAPSSGFSPARTIDDSDFVSEEYFIDSGAGLFRIDLRYVQSMEKKYRNQVAQMINSLDLGKVTCRAASEKFTEAQMNAFYPGGGSAFNFTRPTDLEKRLDESPSRSN